jgi:CheY-like chemotaxis protein
MTILMVEDEELLRVPVAKMLRRRGFVVVETADGRAAMRLYLQRAGEIDVVLLDMTLPGASGADVMALMSIIRPDGKVILTSAFAEETVMAELHGQRPAAYIRKPYSSAQLAELLQATCHAKTLAQSA